LQSIKQILALVFPEIIVKWMAFCEFKFG